MDPGTDEPTSPRRYGRLMLIGAFAAGAVATGTVAAVVTHNSAPRIAPPVQLGSQPAVNQAPAPQPAAQQAPNQHPTAAEGRPGPNATNECFGTAPKPGSTPARPLCDWDKIFADTEARAHDIRQQQRDQLEDRVNELRRSADGGH